MHTQPFQFTRTRGHTSARQDIRMACCWGTWVIRRHLPCLDGPQDGVPTALRARHVAEHMLRADEDQDGVLSLHEFVLWYWAEADAFMPLKATGDAPPAGQ